MGENAPPPTTTTSTDASRGIPYYEKLRRDLRESLQKKRTLDASIHSIEESIYRMETSYLEETGAGNIIKGFDNYIKGSAGGSSAGSGGTLIGGGMGGGGGGTATRRKGGIGDADRIFSKSSASFNRVRCLAASYPGSTCPVRDETLD
jgi:chromatin modification-related protein EAF6